MRGNRAIIIGGVAVLLCGCSDTGPFSGLFRSESPYEQYLTTLRAAGLDSTALGRDWLKAGESALTRALTARLPFRETGYFPPHEPQAVAYQLELRRGRTLRIEVGFDSGRPARLFVDLFERRSGEDPRRVASLAADTTLLEYRVRRDGTYLLRLQPELLRGGRYTLIERTLASLRFPIPGLDTRAVKSSFGAVRDAGAREHHGVDIFAPRGTPAIAVAAGTAVASTNELGGLVVWLRDSERGATYYYAHLDRWAIDGRAAVRAGDTVGFIGNTGNARTTGPHLHFGIYEDGPIDPLPFLAPDDPIPAEPAAPAERLEEWVRVTARAATLYRGPDKGADSLGRLERGWIARVSGVSQRAFRVSLPDESIGYLDANLVVSAERPPRREALTAGSVLRESPNAAAPAIEILSSATAAELLGRFGDFELARLPDARLGWVSKVRGER
ncbi:MAG TPA: M23 family metallopeptidase [Gemmatimonadales bacterium]|nr:M23 family metallopeptidase [Gemmatimonadales bacterium]